MAKSFNDLSPTAQVATLVALPALLAFAVFWYFVKPVFEKRSGLGAEVQALHQENLKNKAFEQQRAQYTSRIAQLEIQLDAVRSTVPDDRNTDGFIDLINDTASKTGVHVRSLVADALVARDLYTEVPFKLRADGTYYAMVEFFDRLARGQRIVSVSSLALGAPARGSLGSYTIARSETVGVNCQVTTYFNSGALAPPVKQAGH